MSDSDNSSDGENETRNKLKSKIPDGFEIESLQEYEELKKKSHDKVQGKTYKPIIQVDKEGCLMIVVSLMWNSGPLVDPIRKDGSHFINGPFKIYFSSFNDSTMV